MFFMDLFSSFACGYLKYVAFLLKDYSFPLYTLCIFVESNLTFWVCICIWILSVPFIFTFIFLLTHCLSYFSFILKSDSETLPMILWLSTLYAFSSSYCIHFIISLTINYKILVRFLFCCLLFCFVLLCFILTCPYMRYFLFSILTSSNLYN